DPQYGGLYPPRQPAAAGAPAAARARRQDALLAQHDTPVGRPSVARSGEWIAPGFDAGRAYFGAVRCMISSASGAILSNATFIGCSLVKTLSCSGLIALL